MFGHKEAFYAMSTLNSMRSLLFREENAISGRSFGREKSSLREEESLESHFLIIREGKQSHIQHFWKLRSIPN